MIEWSSRSIGRAMAALAVIGTTSFLSGCGHENKVTRVDTGTVTDLSGRWNDTDSRMVAETMVKEAVGSPWLDNFTKAKSRQPVAIVGTVINKSRRTHQCANLRQRPGTRADEFPGWSDVRHGKGEA
ncbi:MAG: hypothetical protein U0361_01995 [Nitrospiraceae bacterium]